MRLARTFVARAVLGASLVVASLMAQDAVVRAAKLAQEASVAHEAGNFDTAIARLEEAIELRADFPQFFVALASAQTAAGNLEEAVGTLRRFAKLGVYEAVDKAPEFAPLKARKDFQEVVKAVAANLHPRGKGEIGFTLRDVTGLLHSIAWREKTGEFYFGDVHHRAVWVRNKDNTLRRLTAENEELLGIFALAIDESNGALWVAMSAVPEMEGFTPDLTGSTAVAEIDLETGGVRRVVPVIKIAGSEAVHVLNGLTPGADGSVYATDGGIPLVWRLAPGAQRLERLPESDDFFALQGIAAHSSGALILADQVSGLVALDPARGGARRIVPPDEKTLIELKGLAVSAEGKVLALQSGIRPSRVLAIELDDAAENALAVAVLESGHVAMGAPSLGCIGPAGDFYFIGNSSWSRFTAGQPTAPRQVAVFRTKLAPARK